MLRCWHSHFWGIGIFISAVAIPQGPDWNDGFYCSLHCGISGSSQHYFGGPMITISEPDCSIHGQIHDYVLISGSLALLEGDNFTPRVVQRPSNTRAQRSSWCEQEDKVGKVKWEILYCSSTQFRVDQNWSRTWLSCDPIPSATLYSPL